MCRFDGTFLRSDLQGIRSTNLTADDISVLGNMTCTLDASYIQFSNSSILDALNRCSDLSVDQAAAVEALLVRGQTPHGFVRGRRLSSLVVLPCGVLECNTVSFVSLLHPPPPCW